tara:strand:+ start:51661 stop:52284 length:624 start_codon:yes stop_codon:yes gene_type:complete
MTNKTVSTQTITYFLGKTDMYLIDLLQKGYFNNQLHILDAGCGMGRNLWMLAKLGHTLIGIDQNEIAIKSLNNEINRLKMDQNISARVGELDNLPFTDKEFDFVICNAVLHFAKDVSQFELWFAEIVRVVKPQGVVFLRFVSSHTMDDSKSWNQVVNLPDGSTRFVVNESWLKEYLIPRYNLIYSEEFKTVNVANKRTMTTLVLRAK